MIKVLVIDDDSLMTKALASGLSNYGFDRIQTANSASEAMSNFRSFKPDVCFAFQNKVTFLTFNRRALRLMDEFETEDDIKKAIKWSLNQLGHALAAIAVNRFRKLKK